MLDSEEGIRFRGKTVRSQKFEAIDLMLIPDRYQNASNCFRKHLAARSLSQKVGRHINEAPGHLC